MPVDARELMARIEDFKSMILSKLITDIDSMLEAEFNGKPLSKTLTLSREAEVHDEFLRHEIVEIYSKHGWSVKSEKLREHGETLTLTFTFAYNALAENERRG